ncbi:MAG: B12-binding domain-containing radical SAM protein [Desulfobacteraceae bacterium]|nr:B12-binding domain-containing radical SAM protein [Desulfobacteraceae bacterium]
MKLLLINPSDKNTCAFSNHFPPLSLGYVAGLTPSDWEIELLDENWEEFVLQKADLVAISAMTIQANRAYEICNIYRKMGIPVVVGGIHVSMLPEEALNYATSVVIGEAEGLWQNVIEDFTNGTLKRIYKSSSYPSLSNMVIPRRDLFNKKYLFDVIQTSRGCPFNCDFCSVPAFNGREYRLRPVSEIIEDLKTIRKKFVFIVDDNIVGYGKENEERAIALFEGMIKSGIKKYWVSQASINVSENEKLLQLMKKSGCLGLLIGFESTDVQTLRKSGKTQNLRKNESPAELYKDVINKLHKYGIAVDGYFCYGYEDTQKSILNSFEYILKSGIDIINTPILVPSPGTGLYQKIYNEIEFKDYPLDWNKYLARLVFRPRESSKKDFYKAYIIKVKKLNSIKEILKRSYHSLKWSREPFLTLMIFLFNMGYRRLRKKTISFLLEKDPHFKSAYDELEKR